KVVVETNGLDCLSTYMSEHDWITQARGSVQGGNLRASAGPFDVVILDYRMPGKNGLEVAGEILRVAPDQRIIFASSFVVDTLTESVKRLGQVVELLQKPFGMDTLTDTVEDRGIYVELRKINVKVAALKNSDVTHSQLVDLLTGIKKLEKDIRGL
ncbi:MAG: response regulator, partial [Nitrososphaera sp.]|nr:response regulator [Nitrososphaera sp.]